MTTNPNTGDGANAPAGEPGPGPVLALNVGNTMTSAGIVDDQHVEHVIAVETRTLQTIGQHLTALWDRLSHNPAARVVIGSAVANLTEPLCQVVKQATSANALVIRRDLPLPMALDVDNPETVGVDRVCVAAAAYHRLRHACLVADVGTAITVNLVSDDGVFVGGSILPGPHVAAAALAEHTAALPRVQLRRPERLIGRNTEQAILSGVVFGLAGALRELTERYATELGCWPQLIVTGGGAGLIAEHCDFIDNVVPNLALMGIALTWQLHPDKQPARRTRPTRSSAS